jgi:hypothetical protein
MVSLVATHATGAPPPLTGSTASLMMDENGRGAANPIGHGAVAVVSPGVSLVPPEQSRHGHL